jgi:hypothetical protein
VSKAKGEAEKIINLLSAMKVGFNNVATIRRAIKLIEKQEAHIDELEQSHA